MSDGSVIIDAKINSADFKRDLNKMEKDAEDFTKSASNDFNSTAASMKNTAAYAGKLQNSLAALASSYARGTQASAASINAFAKQSAIIGEQVIAYNTLQKAAQDAAEAEQKAAQAQAASLFDLLDFLNDQIVAKRKEVASYGDSVGSEAELKARTAARKELNALEKESEKVALALAAADDRLAIATDNVGAALKKPVGILPALRAGFSGLLRVLGGPVGIAITAATAAIAYFTGRSKEAKEATEQYSYSIDGLGGSSEETTQGINKLSTAIANMSREQAAFTLDQVEKKVKELAVKAAQLRDWDFSEIPTGGIAKLADSDLNKALDMAVQGKGSFEEFSRAVYAAANANKKFIDATKTQKVLELGKALYSNTIALRELEMVASGAGSSVSEELRRMNESADPKNITEAYKIYRRYIDAQDKGKQTATEAAKGEARLAVERLKEGAAALKAAAATASLNAARADSAGNVAEAERFSQQAQKYYADMFQLYRDADALEAKIPQIKAPGVSTSSFKQLDSFLASTEARIDALNATEPSTFSAKLVAALKDIDRAAKNAKASGDKVDDLKKRFTAAFAGEYVHKVEEDMKTFGDSGAKAMAEVAKETDNYRAALEELRKQGKITSDEINEKVAEFTEKRGKEIKLNNLQEQLTFMKETAEIAGNYGLAVEKQNALIELQAERYRELFAGKPELLEMVKTWEKFQKLQASDKWEDGIQRSAQKFVAEWTNAGKVAEKQFDMVIGAVQELGSGVIDILFDDAEFRADQFLKNLAKQIMQMMMNQMIAKTLTLFPLAPTLPGKQGGGYTGNAPVNQAAAVAHGQEYVLNAKATRAVGISTLDAINSGAGLAVLSSSLPPFGSEYTRIPVPMRATGNPIVFNPEINIEYNAASGASSQEDAQKMANILGDRLRKEFNGLIDQRLITQSRPGGLISRGIGGM